MTSLLRTCRLPPAQAALVKADFERKECKAALPGSSLLDMKPACAAATGREPVGHLASGFILTVDTVVEFNN
ncbi:hypothetical protein BaRGS_00025888 [Batillaria attramentaria]|uniref:Uncharacterized protein n=1 Tax=Batillaria attramentaria TaxID=370345 RepID=A0ABD0K624_9CAEN